MTSYGITEQGYNLKTFDVIFAELVAACRAAFGDEINTQADSVLGQFLGIVADALAEHHELMQAVNAAQDIASASGAQLDVLVAFNNVLRRVASPSQISAYLNLAASTTLPAGRIVSVGSGGAQFASDSDIVNAGTSPAIVRGGFSSVEDGPIVGNAKTVDTIVTPVSGWTAKAVIETANSEPFTMYDDPSMKLEVDEGSPQTVTFLPGAFVVPSAATAAEVAAKINSDTTGITATALLNGKVRIESDTDGAGSAIRALSNADSDSSSATAILGLKHNLFKGLNPDAPARKTSGNAEPFANVNGLTLSYSVNGGSTQVITFDGATLAYEVASQIMGFVILEQTDIRAYDDNGRVVIETVDTGAGVTLEILGGSANAILGFDTLIASGETGDAVAGQLEESDADLKLRYFDQLGIAGQSVLGSIRAAIRALDGVRNAFILENDTDVTDGDGLPPHSIECVVQGGDDDEVGEAIFLKNSSGTETYRDPGVNGRTVDVVDANGDTKQINFSRATDVPLYVDITVKVDADRFGGGVSAVGEELVKAALVALNLSEQDIGEAVIALLYKGATLESTLSSFAVTGVIDVTSFKIDTVFPPVNTANLSVTAREAATLITGNIAVTVTT